MKRKWISINISTANYLPRSRQARSNHLLCVEFRNDVLRRRARWRALNIHITIIYCTQNAINHFAENENSFDIIKYLNGSEFHVSSGCATTLPSVSESAAEGPTPAPLASSRTVVSSKFRHGSLKSINFGGNWGSSALKMNQIQGLLPRSLKLIESKENRRPTAFTFSRSLGQRIAVSSWPPCPQRRFSDNN